MAWSGFAPLLYNGDGKVPFWALDRAVHFFWGNDFGKAVVDKFLHVVEDSGSPSFVASQTWGHAFESTEGHGFRID